MYEKSVVYKFELSDRFFFTGEVIEEDTASIKIHTTRDEEIILNKTEIKRSWKVREVHDER